jgi:hypothetical protein
VCSEAQFSTIAGANPPLVGPFESGAGAIVAPSKEKIPMPKKKRSDAAVATVTKARTSAPTAASSRPPSASEAAAHAATCEGALARVIRLAQAMLPNTADSDGSAAVASPATASPLPGPSSSPDRARELLEKALDELDSEVALKLRTLMIAGRDGKSITDVQVNMTLGDSRAAFAAAALDTSHNGPLLADYLRRGHALACATALDLEEPLAGWTSDGSSTLDERAWLSFGKQLAKAGPDDWHCLAFVESETQSISRLYLRLDEHAWWSFQTVLDRPSSAVVEKEKRTLTSRRSKGLATHSLAALVSRLSSAKGRALRRAARAIRARVGDAAAS